MKPVLLCGLLATLFLCLGSCKNTDDEFLPDDALPPVPEGYIRMQISVPGLTPVSTYALGTVDETHVSEVDVLVFGSDSKYLCYAAVTEPSKIIGTGSTKTFDVYLRAAGNIASAYVMVVANAHDAVQTAVTSFTSSTTKETAMQSITFASSGKWNVTGSSNFKPFPMWGMTAAPVSLAGASSIPSISLIRSVARIDVGLKFPDNVTDGTENAAGLSSTFTLEEIYLYNSLNKGSVAPHSGKYSGTTATAPSIPTPAPGTNDSPVPSYLSSNGTADGFSANKFMCTGAIYMAEHAAGTDALTNNPYLVIGGKYNGSGTVTYYRLDFVSGSYPNQTFLSVLRNHRYRFNITGVSGPGYTSADLASTGLASTRPVNFTYNLSATDESLTSYDYNGQYALGVSQDSYTLDKTARTVSTLKVSTTYGGGYTAVSSDQSWLRFGSAFDSGTASVTGVANTLSTLTFSVAANNTGGARSPAGTITITSGRLTKVVTVTQSNTDAFTVTDPVQSQFPDSGVTNSPLTVTSSYSKWNVRVDSDPNGIVTSFGIGNGGSGGTSGSTGTTGITFSLKASPKYEVSTAKLVFFSPTGEFTEVPKTVNLAAKTYTAQPNPTGHGGWAGSNIYWVSTGSTTGYLTFENTPTNNPTGAPTGKEGYQGVFFKWGNLIGLDPMRYTSGSTGNSWNSANVVYVPNYVTDNPTTSTWSRTTAGSAYTWSNIQPVTSGSGSVLNYAHLTLNASNQSGGYDPANKKGDICRYLSETGTAPGSPGVRWRMPTAAEFAVPAGISNDNDYVKTENGWNNITDTFSGNSSGTWITVDGRRKQYDHATTNLLSYKPFFSAGGLRRPEGSLYLVGYEADWWSSSPNGGSAYRLLFYGDVQPSSSNDRAHAQAVRCVKEL
ncbi:MAG: hypothetical protein LBR26_03795 [Prevotella sp.]|jgi:hypothetical protein|nr:hypothetical protein [Prevotella sp.]